jgi:osmotically-inducible protein OsmY
MAWTMRGDRYDYTPADEASMELPDREVKSTVVHRLRENPYTADGRIRVSVSDGVVQLGGVVTTPEARAVAADDTMTIPGVTDVENRLEVRQAA